MKIIFLYVLLNVLPLIHVDEDDDYSFTSEDYNELLNS